MISDLLLKFVAELLALCANHATSLEISERIGVETIAFDSGVPGSFMGILKVRSTSTIGGNSFVASITFQLQFGSTLRHFSCWYHTKPLKFLLRHLFSSLCGMLMEFFCRMWHRCGLNRPWVLASILISGSCCSYLATSLTL